MNKIWLVLAVAACGFTAMLTMPHTERIVTPLYADPPEETQAIIELPVRPPAWLHVEVETNWAWFWQKSKGRAWITEGRQDSLTLDVGKLCIQLTAHGTAQKCLYGVHEITIDEKKWGVQIAKRTAIVSAWTIQPVLDTVTVKMEP